jgi:stringent starvation protein B
MEYVKNGEIVLNIGAAAVHKLVMGNEVIEFAARFNGVSRDISVPMEAISGIYARETGQGMAFEVPHAAATAAGKTADAGKPADGDKDSGSDNDTPPHPPTKPGGRPKLQIVK